MSKSGFLTLFCWVLLGQSDVTAPSLSSISITPSQVNVSTAPATFSVDLGITDDLTGFNWGWVGFKSASGKQDVTGSIYQVPTSGTARNGVFRATVTIPQAAEAGTWTVYGIALRDAAGNMASILPSHLTAPGFQSTVTVTSGGHSCTAMLGTSTQMAVPETGREATFMLSIGGTECGWMAWSSAPWAQVYPLRGTTSAQVSITVFPNFTSTARTATVTVAGQNVLITQEAMSGTDNLRFVRLAYFNALRRLPPPTDESFHVSRLESGLPRASMMLSFLRSAEFRTGGAFVTALYRVLLGRVPEKGGWDFQLNAVVKSDVPQTAVTRAFLSSEEWMLKQGSSATDDEFVDILYREVLGRTPSSAERAFQVGQFTAGMTRPEMATYFLGAPEFYSRNGILLAGC